MAWGGAGVGGLHEVGSLSLSRWTSPVYKMGFELIGLQSPFQLGYSIND